MSIFKNRGVNQSRAASIISSMNPKEKPETETAVKDVPPVEDKTPPVEAPEKVVPPVEDKTPPEEAAEVEAPPGEDNLPPVLEPGVAKPDQMVVKELETPPVTEVTDDLILSKLSEKLGKKIESYDDLKPADIDPQIAELLKWKEDTGLSLSKWSNYNKDFSKMSDLEIARELLAQKFPNFTKEELDYTLSDYIYNEDVDEDGDKIKKSIALKKAAHEGRQALETNKLKLSEVQTEKVLTPEQKEDIGFAAKMKQQFADNKVKQSVYDQKIVEAVQTLNTIDLQLDKDLAIKFNVPDGVKRDLPKTVAEMPNWYNADGSFNHANVVNDVAKVTNFNAIVEAVYQQGINVGKEGMIKKSANITIDQVQAPDSTQVKKGNIEDIVNNITGGNRKSKLRFGKVK
jgi:hypothetical protein